MSQTHTHGPGTHPGRTHGPPSPQQMVIRPPDPVAQAMIKASCQPVDVVLGQPDNVSVLCGKHKLEKCADCDIDYVGLNRLARQLQSNSNLRCPPPPQLINKHLSQVIATTKEEGNTLFKGGLYDKAIQHYTMAANFATQRGCWETQAVMREELSTVLSNRAAAYFELGDYIASLVDADVVIQIRRAWSKGHFRKAKALFKLERIEEARDAIQVGLAFEPENRELKDILGRIDAVIGTIKHSASTDLHTPIPTS